MLARANRRQKWVLYGISKVYGQGSAEYERKIFNEEFDDIVPLNNMKGVSYVALSRKGKWGLIELSVTDPFTLECAWKWVAEIEHDSLDGLLATKKIDTNEFTPSIGHVGGYGTSDRQLEDLFREGKIRIKRGNLFDHAMPAKTQMLDFDRVAGMLLGIAIGDALGITTESMLPAARRTKYGELRDYIPNRYVNEARGFPSDDTQLAFWTLEQLVKDGMFVPEHVAEKFANNGQIFGIGTAVREFLANLKSGRPWDECGTESAGNGALMRIAPILIPHLKKGGVGIWNDTALLAMMTHNDYASTSACLAFVAMLVELLDMKTAPPPQWWCDRYVVLAMDLEGATSYVPRGGKHTAYKGPLWRFVQERLPDAYSRKLSVREACDEWYSGAFLLETVPSVLYVLMCHAHDPEEAIVRAVNDTKDNDTIAAIVGAAVGALHGQKGLPERWITNLSGRTTDRDDGCVFALIDDARRMFWHYL